MKTLNLTDEEFAALTAALGKAHGQAHAAAVMIVNDDGQHKRALKEIARLIERVHAGTPERIPVRDFVENGWSFRRVISDTRDVFQVYPKGERSHWSQRASLYRSPSGCWSIGITGVYSESFHTFAEAKAYVLKIIGRNE